MLKGLFGKRPTNKQDVVLAVVGAVMAAWSAVNTYTEYKDEREKEKEIDA